MSELPSHRFISLSIAVLTISDTRTLRTDTSGGYLADAARQAGHQLVERSLIEDNVYTIRAEVSAWIARDDIQVVLATGGTGLTTRDSTPEAVLPLLDKRIEGFGELFRHLSLAEIGTSTIQSRTLAGLANRTLIICMPGSTKACRTGWEQILVKQLDAREGACNLVTHVTQTSTDSNTPPLR